MKTIEELEQRYAQTLERHPRLKQKLEQIKQHRPPQVVREIIHLEKEIVGQGVMVGSQNYFPEAKLLGRGKHGLDWTEGPARLLNTGIAQGKFQHPQEIAFATQKGAEIGLNQTGLFSLPPNSSAIVYMLKDDEVIEVSATHVFVKVYASGKIHAYPSLGE
jgi:hypothetical protein